MSAIDYITIGLIAYCVTGYCISVASWLTQWGRRVRSDRPAQWGADDLVGAMAVAMFWPAFLCIVASMWWQETKGKRSVVIDWHVKTQGETHEMSGDGGRK